MSLSQDGITSARALPARPSLKHLKNEAKGRLQALRATAPGAKLADAQFQLAREYGFSSWRELKAEVDRRAAEAGPDILGDWVRDLAEGAPRIALRVARGPRGDLLAVADFPETARYDMPVDTIDAAGGHLSMTMTQPSVSVLYEAQWDAQAGRWAGVWRGNDIERPVSFVRGAYPPLPSVEGLDGVWDGVIGNKDPARITLRIRTGPHGTLARCDSPDRTGYDLPATAVTREGDHVEVKMQAASFSGELSADGAQIAAIFQRGETKAHFTLTRRAPGAAPPAPPKAPFAVAPAVLAGYAGRYQFDPQPVAAIAVADGVLHADLGGTAGLVLVPVAQDQFFCRPMDATFTFERGAAGEVTAVVVRQQGRDLRGRRV